MSIQNTLPLLKHLLSKVLLLALLVAPVELSALYSDAKQPVSIDANSATMNKLKGYAVYEGNVIITQGTLKITAHRIEIFAPRNAIQKIVAHGSPVKLEQKMDNGNHVKAKANKLTYQVSKKNVILVGNANVVQGQDRVSSQYIQYLMNTGEIKAGDKTNNSRNSSNRVRAIFYPSKK
ncbi:MAG: lipopolysaccharide transport periplasmic protein LptA [Thiotrichaceae bacterium]|nr:lipopolysaccharide transport periplasmic protein LptA [Thiotrichaceae bacterium]